MNLVLENMIFIFYPNGRIDAVKCGSILSPSFGCPHPSEKFSFHELCYTFRLWYLIYISDKTMLLFINLYSHNLGKQPSRWNKKLSLNNLHWYHQQWRCNRFIHSSKFTTKIHQSEIFELFSCKGFHKWFSNILLGRQVTIWYFMFINSSRQISSNL